MRTRRCTSLLPAANGHTKCGHQGPCTRVRKLDADGNEQWARWVCFNCRQRMRLPEHDVDFGPDHTIYDHMTPWNSNTEARPEHD